MTDLILDAITRGGYVGIFLLMALENIIPPIPSEVIMGFGGMALSRGQFSFWPLLLIGNTGTVAGNVVWYWVGRRFGYHGLKPVIARWGRVLTLEWDDVERIHRYFRERGAAAVFVFRFLPTFRTMISLPAGMAGMPFGRFLLWTFLGSLIWNGALIGGGVLLDTHFRELDRYLGPVAIGSFVLAGAFYLYRVVTWKPRGS
jgi:membrane protein DedA with SNARE-associated domain